MDPHMLADMDPPLAVTPKAKPEPPPSPTAVPEADPGPTPIVETPPVTLAAAAIPPPSLDSVRAVAAAAPMLAPGVAAIIPAITPGGAQDAPAATVVVRPTLLEVDGLAMRFGGLMAVDNLSFVARRGEITALIGPNGAGKTTVFNCITGFYRPTAGAIRLHREGAGPIELQRLADFEITAKARVARTFQNIRLFAGMTVLENLMVAQHRRLTREAGGGVIGALRSVFRTRRFRDAEKAGIARAVAWLDRIGLTARADDPAGDLPYGDQRRLEIARAMLTEPVLLCLDEPAAGLNPRESADLAQLLRTIRDDLDTAILLIEHDMSVVMDISDHVVVLDYGRRISDGAPAFVKNDPNVIKAYLGVEHDELPADTPADPAAVPASAGSGASAGGPA
jgi:branched-chain amino acid transport system ATP-binding protein